MPSPDPQPLRLATKLCDLPGVGTTRARRLRRLGIETVTDLLRHLPMRYERESAESDITSLPMGELSSARGTIVACRWVPARAGGTARFEATLEDHAERLYLVWFNSPHLRTRIRPGAVLRVRGKVKPFGGYPQMVNPRWELLDEQDAAPTRSARLQPVYPATEDLPSSVLESLISRVLPEVFDQIVDPLAPAHLAERAMPMLGPALRWAHQPADDEQARAARRRLAYNELLLLQLGIAVKRYDSQHRRRAPALHCSAAIHRHICARFPFELTESQGQVIAEIAADLQCPRPMNRLLQGDVGAGKTVVALYALLLAVCNRRQGALMAPTELLAEQHHLSIGDMLAGSDVRVALLTAGSAAAGSAARRALLERIADGDVDLVVGTQALLGGDVRFRNLAVVVVDEQHRFGVIQRAAVRQQDGDEDAPGLTPHCLVMTATPIPRTLSLTVFGDVDISTIRGLPPGRTPIATRVVGPGQADAVYDYLVQRVGAGDQAYVVVPAIEEGDDDARVPLKNVRELAGQLQQRVGDEQVAPIHGRLKREQREAIMHRFRDGVIRVLVATTVIEVGVDVPNATLMVVEHAERFGLAQLHQLRGRIGRGSDGRHSVCVFIANATTPEAEQRMAAIAASADGFVIAERDLEIRGMGDFFGTRQSGMPPLRVARIPDDLDLLQLARRDAGAMVEADPTLQDPAHLPLRGLLIGQYGDALGLIDVG